MILGFYELPDDERPPEAIWTDDEALSSHWLAVEQKREAKWGGGSETSEAVPEAGTRMDQNELTAGLKDRLGSKRG
jgi:hypothetical protein